MPRRTVTLLPRPREVGTSPSMCQEKPKGVMLGLELTLGWWKKCAAICATMGCGGVSPGVLVMVVVMWLWRLRARPRQS